MTSKDTETMAPHILALEAFEYVKRDQTDTYEAMAEEIDRKVQESEPGMLVHALTKISEDETETIYRWLEVFENAEALKAHIENPAVVAHIAKMNDGVLSGPTEIVLYTDWNETQKAHWREVFAGTKLVFAPTLSGFYVKR